MKITKKQLKKIIKEELRAGEFLVDDQAASDFKDTVQALVDYEDANTLAFMYVTIENSLKGKVTKDFWEAVDALKSGSTAMPLVGVERPWPEDEG